MERLKGKSLLLFPADCCVVDIETTGLDPEFCEIIEVAALRIRGGEIAAQFSELIKPSEPIDEFITELTGITNDMLEDAPYLDTVLPAFREFIGSDQIVGHNVHFDINFLYDSSEMLGLSTFSNDFIDTMRIARIVLPELPHHRLRDLTKHYQITNPQAHRAAGDCIATHELLHRLNSDAETKQIDISKRPQKTHCRAKELTAQTDTFDETHPLYKKMCVFTGALSRMTRREAMQLVLNLGGICGDGVTKNTDFLIIGNTEYCSNIRGKKTEKMKKAEDLILKGNDLTIISESVFYDLIQGEDIEDNDNNDSNDNKNYDKLIQAIRELSHKAALNLEMPDGFFELVENQKSHSLWIVEPMTKARAQMVLTVERRGKSGQKYGRLITKKTVLDKIGEIDFFTSNNDSTLSYLDINDLTSDHSIKLWKIICHCAESFTPSERFGCCHLFRECSIARKCLHSDLFYARACWYRKNLENGKIFY